MVIETTGRPENFQRALEIAEEVNVKTIPPLDGGIVWLPEPYDEPFMFVLSLKGGTSIRHPWWTTESSTLTRTAHEFIRLGYMKADKVVSHDFPLDKTKIRRPCSHYKISLFYPFLIMNIKTIVESPSVVNYNRDS